MNARLEKRKVRTSIQRKKTKNLTKQPSRRLKRKARMLCNPRYNQTALDCPNGCSHLWTIATIVLPPIRLHSACISVVTKLLTGRLHSFPHNLQQVRPPLGFSETHRTEVNRISTKVLQRIRIHLFAANIGEHPLRVSKIPLNQMSSLFDRYKETGSPWINTEKADPAIGNKPFWIRTFWPRTQ